MPLCVGGQVRVAGGGSRAEGEAMTKGTQGLGLCGLGMASYCDAGLWIFIPLILCGQAPGRWALIRLKRWGVGAVGEKLPDQRQAQTGVPRSLHTQGLSAASGTTAPWFLHSHLVLRSGPCLSQRMAPSPAPYTARVEP